MTPENQEPMKSCPFCGGDPSIQDHKLWGIRVFCDGGPNHSIFIGGDTINEAIAAWNQRP